MSSKSSNETGATRKPRFQLIDHQRIRNEQRERLAQRAGADAVVVLEVLDAEFCAGRQGAFDDVPMQAEIRRFDERLRFGARFGLSRF